MAHDYQVGTGWKRWDLHIHTPVSAVQHYGGDSNEVWEKFICDLESMPDDLSVIGISDYWFLDGYKRLRQEKAKGRLRNIDEIFPVLEMRLSNFGGSGSKLSRANLHVVFDPELDADFIYQQFIVALAPEYRLSPEQSDLRWQSAISRESITDLGKRVKETVPQDRLSDYGSDFVEGFNALNVDLVKVLDVLNRPHFEGKALVGLGKTEWASIQWNDNTIASKKDLINRADFIFSAYDDVNRWQTDVAKHKHDRVTHRFLDCSDAHAYSDSENQNRIGQCQTWMNTTPTFSGLRYALSEFDRRVYIGLEPPSRARMRRSPETFLTRVEVRGETEDHSLFQHDIPLNSGFVAIVGNKGQGKSALLDCIALAGNSSRHADFAFLNRKRFLSGNNIRTAAKYTSTVHWESGKSRSAVLNDGFDQTSPISVEYLPQAFVERVCNIDPSTDDASDFEDELRSILFSHIADEDRLGCATFDELMERKSRMSNEEISGLRGDLKETIDEYASLTEFVWENRLADIDSRLDIRRQEVSQAESDLAEAQSLLDSASPSEKSDEQITELNRQASEISESIERLSGRRDVLRGELSESKRILDEMAEQWQKAKEIANSVAHIGKSVKLLLGEDTVELISVSLNESGFMEWKANAEKKIEAATRDLASVSESVEKWEQKKKDNDDELTAIDRQRALLRQKVNQVRQRRDNLIGSEQDSQSLRGLEQLRNRVTEAPANLAQLRDKLMAESRLIHEAQIRKLHSVEALYQPASQYIEASDVVRNVGLEFSADITILSKELKSLSDALDGRRNSSFVEWVSALPSHMPDKTWTSVGEILEEAIERLLHRGGEVDEDAAERDPRTALTSSHTLKEFLNRLLSLSWLDVRFSLLGEGRPLTQLSPGERGLLLALFYLIVDQNTTPLLLDQPEENLDNATIAAKLVPAIHEAAGRRQTIVVTHNANLAIVGDADQIIYCEFSDGSFTASSGCIADLNTAQYSVDVLEGTKKAFDNRSQKYKSVS